MAIRVTVWNEYLHEVQFPEVAEVYPKGIHGCIADFLKDEGMEVRTATLREPEHGLAQEVLDNTDVLTWWGHMAHGEVSDEIVNRVYKRVMGDEARVALLSFSTKGSAKHERVDKVRAALEEIKTREPNLLVDGELQLDAAVEPEVARLKAPGSPVAGNANVFVFPSLEAGNIGYKIAQRFGGWTALGPLLQGFAHGWHDLSRGCSSDDIYKISVVGLGMNRGGQQ